MMKPLTALAMASAVSAIVARAEFPELECPAGTTVESFGLPHYHEQWCMKPGPDGQPVRHGPYVRRYADGTLAKRGSFRDGRHHGLQHRWHPNGARASEETYRDGRREGIERRWSEGGLLTARTAWRDDNQHGRFEEWSWEDGVKVADGEYTDGLPAGHWTHWDRLSGQLFGVFEFDPAAADALRRSTHDELSAMSSESAPSPPPTEGDGRGLLRCVSVARDQPVVVEAAARAAPYPMFASQAPPLPAALSDCPPGARVHGAPPPVGDRQWCAKQGEAGEWQRHGPYLEWHANGTVALTRHFLSDRPEGAWWYYSDEGRAEAFLTFHEGTLSGPAVSWYPNGRPAAHACFDGVPSGETWSWHPDGILASRVEQRDGHLDGLSRTWHASGKPSSRGEYRQGRENGEWRWWRAEGSPDALASFRDAELHGTATRYWPSGARWFEGAYREGARVGPWKFFYQNGSPAGEGTYVDGRRSGRWKLWPSSGGAAQTVEFDAGEPVSGTAPSAAACRPLPGYPGECYRLDITPGLEPRMDPDDVARDVIAYARRGSEPGSAPPFRNLRIAAFVQRHNYGNTHLNHADPGWIWRDESVAGIYWVARADGGAMVSMHARFHGAGGKSGSLILSDRTGRTVGSETP